MTKSKNNNKTTNKCANKSVVSASDENKKQTTMLNKKYRLPISVNARRYKGEGILYATYVDEGSGRTVERYIDKETANGGTMTPFNIQCNCDGACAIRTIVKQGDDTFVVFADGDRVCLHRHENDKDDPVTTVMWALGQKVFGKNIIRQIHTALKYRLVYADLIHRRKAFDKEGIAPEAGGNS